MSYQLRIHQIDAINSIIESLENGKKNIHVNMTLGSGITITCFATLQKLLNVYSFKTVVILTEGSRYVDQLVQLKNEFWKETFNDSNLVIQTTKSFLKQEFHPSILVLFNINSSEKNLSNYLDNFTGIVLNFSSHNKLKSNDTNHFFNTELVYNYSIQEAISSIPKFLDHELINEINKRVKSILEVIESVMHNLGVNQLQSIAKAQRIIIQNLSQLNYEYTENKLLIAEFVKHELSISDVKEIGNRKKQLNYFNLLLNDDNFFKSENEKSIGGIESFWQSFFERNKWILGVGLNQLFHSSLDDKKLEQTIAGFSINSSGKRVDALMKSKGLIENLCFIELKTHATQLMNDKPYRKECFSATQEFSGAIAQIQKTVDKAEKIIKGKLEINDDYGNPTGEVLFNYKPKAYLIIGSLKEFETGKGINNQKYASFEIFRKSINNLEIITFDELYEKVKFLAIYN
jgi:hypothetical protein